MLPIYLGQDIVGYVEKGEFSGWVAYVYEAGTTDSEPSSSSWRSRVDAVRWVLRNGVAIKEAA
jgi:hypothetical protein